MPELPEVETVRAGVEQHVVGRTVAVAEVMNPRAVRRDLSGPAGFAAAMAGRTFLRAERRGKYLWFALDDNEALLAHLGMSGQLLVGDPGRPIDSHVRARFTFTDGGPDLRFTDQRTFGHLMLCPLAAAFPVARESPGPGGLGRVPEYVVKDSGPDHQKLFRAVVKVGSRDLGTGEGRSKKAAEQLAAEAAYREITTEKAGQGHPERVRLTSDVPQLSPGVAATGGDQPPALHDAVPTQPPAPEPAQGSTDS